MTVPHGDTTLWSRIKLQNKFADHRVAIYNSEYRTFGKPFGPSPLTEPAPIFVRVDT